MISGLHNVNKGRSNEAPGKVYEVELRPRRVIVIIIVSGLLIFGLWSYGSNFLSFVLASPEYPIVITSVITRDLLGNPTSTFSGGDVVVIDVTITYPSAYYFYYYYYSALSISYMQFIETFDPTLYVMSIGFTQDTIDPGGTKMSGTGFTLPPAVLAGTYSVDVYVWNHWPAQAGWVAYAASYTVTFTVS